MPDLLSHPMAVTAAGVLLTGLSGGVAWGLRMMLGLSTKIGALTVELRDLRHILTGVDGDNGLRSEVRALRRDRHDERNERQELLSRVDALEINGEHRQRAIDEIRGVLREAVADADPVQAGRRSSTSRRRG